MTHLRKLVGIGSDPISAEPPDLPRLDRAFGPFVAEQIGRLLTLKNGFYAFEGALHVFPDVAPVAERGLHDWNDPASWRSDYAGMAESAVFFAEDAFGTQFCIRDAGVATFDPETGAFEQMAVDVEEWASKVLGDYSFWSGHAVARAWQLQHGPLPVGARLVPTTPFVLGGKYEAANVHAVDAVKGMKYRASIAVQIRDLPDGASITLNVIE